MKNSQTLQKIAYSSGLLACASVPFLGMYAPEVPAKVVLALGISGLMGLWAGFAPYTVQARSA